jgi:putative transposase
MNPAKPHILRSPPVPERALVRRGAWLDNVLVERLWKSIKYEEIYRRAYDSVSEAKAGITRYVAYYNTRHPHTALDRHTPPPDAVYFNPWSLAATAQIAGPHLSRP